jgi:uncharacterized protein
MITLLASLSEACNLRCTYCNVDKESNKRIDVDAFIQYAHTIRDEFPQETIQIDFFGGEPLLQYNSIKFFLPTNGLLLTPSRLQFLLQHKVQISLSFDGIWQNTNRVQPGGKGTLSRYEPLLPLLRSIPNLQIHTMIQENNYNLLENYLFIHQMFGVNPSMTLVRDVGTWNINSSNLVKRGVTELVDWYIENADTKAMPNFLLSYYRHIILYKLKKFEVQSCGVGDTHLAFSENTAVPCTRFKDRPEYITQIPAFRQMSACQTCEVKHYCTKGCMFEQIKNGEPISELCDIYQHIYREVFRMISALNTTPAFITLTKREVLNEC